MQLYYPWFWKRKGPVFIRKLDYNNILIFKLLLKIIHAKYNQQVWCPNLFEAILLNSHSHTTLPFLLCFCVLLNSLYNFLAHFLLFEFAHISFQIIPNDMFHFLQFKNNFTIWQSTLAVRFFYRREEENFEQKWMKMCLSKNKKCR